MAHISPILDDDNELQVTPRFDQWFLSPSLSCFSRLGYHASPSHLPASARRQHVPSIMLRNVKSFVRLSVFPLRAALVSGRLELIRVWVSLLPQSAET